MKTNIIINGDCIEEMKKLPDNSVDAIITDPPYDLTSQRVYSKEKEVDDIKGNGTLARNIKENTAYGSMVKGFMGKTWDGTGIAFKVDTWKEALRILKPGGHLLSFGGTRTYHRMACAIEDAGFEIRDCIEWVYGSGFPKSLNISKSIDKLAGAKREPILDENGNQVWTSQKQGKKSMFDGGKERPATYPATYPAKYWNGYGTALKPSHEPIVLARKPLSEKTVAENVLKWGTGGINIDGCRVQTNETIKVSGDLKQLQKWKEQDGRIEKDKDLIVNKPYEHNLGRFPANLIHDGSEEVLREFEKAGISKSQIRIVKPEEILNKENTVFETSGYKERFEGGHNDYGTPARFFKSCEFSEEDYPPFFYTAKASKSERNMGCEELEEKRGGCMEANVSDKMQLGGASLKGEPKEIQPRRNIHPTVKPIKLMEYLIKMVTPKGGIVLEPFAGSGTTLVACKKLGYNFIGIEKEPEYIKIIEARLSAIKEEQKQL